MAKTNSGNGDAAKREAAAKAQAWIKSLSTPIPGATTLDDSFAVAASAVLVNVGTWVVPKKVPSEADFAMLTELAFQDTPVLKASEDYNSLVEAVVAVHSEVSHDRRKYAYSEALRIAAEKFCKAQGASSTEANVKQVIAQFREVSGEYLAPVQKMISDAMTGDGTPDSGVLMLRRDRRATTSGDKVPAMALNVLGVLGATPKSDDAPTQDAPKE